MPDQTPRIPVGVSTALGTALAVGSAAAAVLAGIDGNDTATVTAGGVAFLTAAATIGSRAAQAVTALRVVGRASRPWVDAVQDVLDPPADGDDSVHEAPDGAGTVPDLPIDETESAPDPGVDLTAR